MSKDNVGGAAFPTPHDPLYLGMSLRDYFAAKAMQGLMGRAWGDVPAEELVALWSKSAYTVADAMLKAREA